MIDCFWLANNIELGGAYMWLTKYLSAPVNSLLGAHEGEKWLVFGAFGISLVGYCTNLPNIFFNSSSIWTAFQEFLV